MEEHNRTKVNISEKDKRISELEIMLKGASQSNEDKLKSLVNDEKEKEKEKDIEENKEDKSLIISENNYQSQKVLENEKGKDKEKEEDKDKDKDINIDKNKNEPIGSLRDMNLSQLNEKKENEDEKNGEINSDYSCILVNLITCYRNLGMSDEMKNIEESLKKNDSENKYFERCALFEEEFNKALTN